MNKKFKKSISILLSFLLLMSSMGSVFAAGSERTAYSADDPFRLMYDSDEQLAERIEEMPGLELKLESASEPEPGFVMPDVAAEAEVIRAEAAELVRSGDIEAVFELELPEEVLEELEVMAEESGEDRYIVKYKGATRRTVLGMARMTGETEDLGFGVERITLPEKVNPAVFAETLRDAGMADWIEYIQPDFTLEMSEVSLTLDKVETPEGTVIEPEVSEELEEPVEEPEEPEVTEEAEPTEELEEETEEIEEIFVPRSVLVAVIDTGIDIEHELIKDYITGGWNFVGENDIVFDEENPSDSAHGTHVAGVIAETARAYGADVTILPLKVFEGGRAYTSDIIRAIEYAEAMGADIINCSFGSTSENPALLEAIEGSSALFIAAAGNARSDLAETPYYPAAYRVENLISVGSVNADDGFSYFSNYSPEFVDMTALGRDVYSAYPGNEYGNMTGTSMSAAAVSGAAAVVKSLAQDVEETTVPVIDESISFEEELGGTLEPVEVSDKFEAADTAEPVQADGEPGTAVTMEPVQEDQTDEFNKAEVIDGEVYGPELAPEMTALELKERMLKGSELVLNLFEKVENGRRLNVANSIAGTQGGFWEPDYEDDFDVHGYNPTSEELWELFSASGVPVQVEAGSSHSTVLMPDGTVWSWGSNGWGQLGNGTTTSSSTPVQVIGLTDVVKVASGGSYNLAIKSDGTLWTWGGLYKSVLSSPVMNTTATQIEGITNVAEVAAGERHALAVKENGTVFIWGRNNSGELGFSNYGFIYVPTQVAGLTNVIQAGAGESSSVVLKDDGTVWSWGKNYSGILGNNSTVESLVPVQARNLTNVIKISAAVNYVCYALKDDGTVWGWGSNSFYQLGNNSSSKVYYPVQISGLSNVVDIAAGDYHGAVIKDDGTVWTWGYNYDGQLGNGTTSNGSIRTPIQISSLLGAQDIALGNSHNVVFLNDSSIWCWGYNFGGQLGDGTNITRSSPVKVTNLPDIIKINSLEFEEDNYTVEIPVAGNATVNVKASAYDLNGNIIGNANTEYYLDDSYIGVSVNRNTGAVSVSYLASPCEVNIIAASGALTSMTTLTIVPQIIIENLSFEENAYSLQIPDSGQETITVSARGYDEVDNLIENLDITYSFDEPYPGVMIDSATGVVTVSYLASPCEITVIATYENLTAETTLVLSRMNTGPILEEVVFESDQYSILIPDVGQSMLAVNAYGIDSEDNIVDDLEIAYSFDDTYSGVIIDSETGVVTVSYLASPGEITIIAEYEDLMATVTLTLNSIATLKELAFEKASYSVRIPNVGQLTLTVNAYGIDSEGNVVGDLGIAYSLDSTYAGVMIDSETGVVTVSYLAEPCEITVLATYGDMTATAALRIRGAGMADTVLELEIEANNVYTVSARGSNIQSFAGTSFVLEYDPAMLEVVDLCALTWADELETGAVAGTVITIIDLDAGLIEFTFDRTIPVNMVWSGVMNVVKFKSLGDGETEITLTPVTSTAQSSAPIQQQEVPVSDVQQIETTEGLVPEDKVRAGAIYN